MHGLLFGPLKGLIGAVFCAALTWPSVVVLAQERTTALRGASVESVNVSTAPGEALQVYLLKLVDTGDMPSNPWYLKRVGNTVSFGVLAYTDVYDDYLWRWNQFTNSETQTEQVQLQSVSSGLWLSISNKGTITVDKTVVSGWETMWLNKYDYDGGSVVQLRSYATDRYIGANYEAVGYSPKPQVVATAPNGWETFNLIRAVQIPQGEWVPVGSATSSKDVFTFYVSYSSQLSTSETNSLSESFTISVKEGMEFAGESESTEVSSTTATKISKTVASSLTKDEGYKFEHTCPSTVCDGSHFATIYQWKVGAALHESDDELSVMTLETAVFAWDEPKCAWTLCADVQCQTCKSTAQVAIADE